MLNRRLSDLSLADFLAHTSSKSEFNPRSTNQREPSDAADDLGRQAQRAGGIPWLVSADESQLYYMGAGYEALTGLTCADLYADPDSWMDALHPSERDRVVAQMEARGRGPHDDERDAVYRLVHPGASARRVRVCSWPVCDDDGCVLFRAGIVIDVTECGEEPAAGPLHLKRQRRL